VFRQASQWIAVCNEQQWVPNRRRVLAAADNAVKQVRAGTGAAAEPRKTPPPASAARCARARGVPSSSAGCMVHPAKAATGSPHTREPDHQSHSQGEFP